MSIKESVEDYLENELRFRERKNKDKGVVILLARRYQVLAQLLKREEIGMETVTAIIQDAYSMDRAWRQALQHDPNLRGSDYEEKEALEAEKQIALGYLPGFEADVRKLQTL